MAPTVFILLSALLGVGVVYAGIEVSVDPNVVANPGDTVRLKCLVHGIEEPLNMEKLKIHWHLNWEKVAEYDNRIKFEKCEMSLSLEALRKGDASLTIQSFRPEHAGKYRCLAFYNTAFEMEFITLSANETAVQTEGEVELTVLDKKLDKVINWISKVEGKLDDVTRSCSSQRDKTRRK